MLFTGDKGMDKPDLIRNCLYDQVWVITPKVFEWKSNPITLGYKVLVGGPVDVTDGDLIQIDIGHHACIDTHSPCQFRVNALPVRGAPTDPAATDLNHFIPPYIRINDIPVRY